MELERTLLVVKSDRRWVSDITTNDDKIRFYTGLGIPSCVVFRSLLEYMQPKVEEKNIVPLLELSYGRSCVDATLSRIVSSGCCSQV